MSEPIVFVVILIAIAIGFFLGRMLTPKAPQEPGVKDLPWLRQSYFEGLNHLLNERPDDAIDAFVSALEVNSDTLETHFALGNLLRRRGEVDRAIRIHQNLLARPSLSAQQQQQAQIELALDYMRSGLLDRAEALFKELTSSNDYSIRGEALERLVDIYRDEKEWEKAIAMAGGLCQRKLGREVSYWRNLQAHFSCELAEQALEEGHWSAARAWARKALGFDRDSIRAHLDIARIDMAEGRFELAAKNLRKITSTSPLFISEAVPLIRECYVALEQQEVARELLEQLYREQPNELLLQHVSELILMLEGDDAARAFLAPELEKFPSLDTMARIVKVVEHRVACHVKYQELAPVFESVLMRDSAYDCYQCGFSGHQMHWCCPSCKSWGSIFARFSSPDHHGTSVTGI
jgi:lipopolysaccharide biosynthesis regulator YciM